MLLLMNAYEGNKNSIITITWSDFVRESKSRGRRRQRGIIMPHRINKWLDIFSRIITKIMKIDVVLAGH
jgi:hypothetical protein